MTPNHHPLPETLISYAAGTLPNAMSCVVACHLTMCRTCADHVRGLEFIGGAMLGRLEAEPAGAALAEQNAAHWSGPSLPGEPDAEPASQTNDPLLPVLLTRYLGMAGRQVSWKTVVAGAQHYWIALPKGSGQMRLLRLAPGQFLFEHTHRSGSHLALVLQGVYSDDTGDYVRGDVIEWAEDPPHQPRASGDVESICLIASDVRLADMARPYDVAHPLHRTGSLPQPRFRSAWRPTPALAAGVAIIFGIGLGWLLHGTGGNAIAPNGLVQIEGNRLIAGGPLQTALDSVPSGKEMPASVGSQEFRVGVKMTFRNQSGDYCRQYQITSSSPERFTGIACRSGDQWAVKIQALVPASRSASDQTSPAGGADPAMDAVVGVLIDGDPLAGDDEATLLNRDWKK